MLLDTLTKEEGKKSQRFFLHRELFAHFTPFTVLFLSPQNVPPEKLRSPNEGGCSVPGDWGDVKM